MSGRAEKATAAVRDTGELTVQMQRLWQDLPQGVISDLIESMPRRISACIAARVYLTIRFKEVVTPDRDVTIDESLMLFKERLGWKQYMPLKRSRFGIKSYMLCESKSGYVWSLIIYTGRGTLFDEKYKHMCMSSQVVMTLMEPLLNKGHCLTTDNFYSSPVLADILIQSLTDMYGTLKSRRKDVPKELLSKKN
ncbi:piggyBac transposable element-derived protein 4 [Trichonephila clavipes]|nr:piggyBac transposable element-derived protein 4 [Trichonephila clavipes]